MNFVEPPDFALTIDKAVYILCDHKAPRHAKLEALFKFCSWIRWPTKPIDHMPAIASCTASYAKRRFGAKTIAEIGNDYIDIINRNLSIDLIRRLCSKEGYDLPTFEIYNIYNQPHNETQVLADIIWFLIAKGKSQINSRNSASLSKAHYLLRRNAFKYQWPISRSTFINFWAQNGAAAPFFYLENYHPGLVWTIDPLCENFADDVDEILDNQGAIRLFFGQSRFLIERLQAQLDARALKGTIFPNFPADLKPVPIASVALPSSILALLNDFRKGAIRF